MASRLSFVKSAAACVSAVACVGSCTGSSRRGLLGWQHSASRHAGPGGHLKGFRCAQYPVCHMLLQVINQLIQAGNMLLGLKSRTSARSAQVHPFRISEEQCNHYMSRWVPRLLLSAFGLGSCRSAQFQAQDRELKNSVTWFSQKLKPSDRSRGSCDFESPPPMPESSRPAEFLLLARYCIVMGYLTYLVENQELQICFWQKSPTAFHECKIESSQKRPGCPDGRCDAWARKDGVRAAIPQRGPGPYNCHGWEASSG